jgi:protein-S-isoprenylcysteine O-methyltransferase Ste14
MKGIQITILTGGFMSNNSKIEMERGIMSIAWFNLISLHISGFLFAFLAILSTMPVTLSEKRGERAWEECKWIRYTSFVFALIMVMNTFLWVLFPVPELVWTTGLEFIPRLFIVVALSIPSLLICGKAMKDAGEEMNYPVRETTLHGGIYNYVRHPGVWGEMPLYVWAALLVDSLFLVGWMTIYIILYSGINIYFEEIDLVKRFGSEYEEYRERTGMLIPRRR